MMSMKKLLSNCCLTSFVILLSVADEDVEVVDVQHAPDQADLDKKKCVGEYRT